MDRVAPELIAILQYLLPGFLAAWVFYGFTSFPKPSEFERVIQALIFTLIVQFIVAIEETALTWIGQWISLGYWSKNVELGAATLTATVVGAVFSFLANSDKCHKLARRVGITRQTSYPSEWFGVLLQNVTYVVLHLKDERRLYGWPREWPSSPVAGHFQLEQVSWLEEKGERPIKGVSSVLVSVKDVKWIEFMEKTWEIQNVEKRIESTATKVSSESESPHSQSLGSGEREAAATPTSTSSRQ